eukprot:4519162-Lingulodinium_polyedra.AAC.1
MANSPAEGRRPRQAYIFALLATAVSFGRGPPFTGGEPVVTPAAPRLATRLVAIRQTTRSSTCESFANGIG